LVAFRQNDTGASINPDQTTCSLTPVIARLATLLRVMLFKCYTLELCATLPAQREFNKRYFKVLYRPAQLNCPRYGNNNGVTISVFNFTLHLVDFYRSLSHAKLI
jgi:hypothetical protein